MEVKISVIKGPDRGKRYTIRKSTSYLVGRGPDARIRFTEDPFISRRHFLLEVSPPKVYFRDIDVVTNPSRINDVYVEELELADGDIIEVGYTKLKISIQPEMKTKQLPCVECGKTVTFYEDETHEPICPNCEESKKLQQLREEDTLFDPIEITCVCGENLTVKANSDGFAQSLSGKVRYYCKNCLPRKGDAAGKIIKDYEVIDKLGEGGMGKVYLSYQPTTARMVAIKEMNIDDANLGARFDRETRIMKKIRHENVLTYVDSGQDKSTGKPYLVMEYATCGSLDEVMAKNDAPFTPKEAVRYIIDSLKGLEYIHSKGIVHRDIKVENILLTDMGDGEMVPKITDFGLANEFSKAGGSVLTKMGQALGTIMYMPPEQLMDTHSVREPGDLYSMGVTLYYILTGKYPYHFPSPMDITKFLKANKHRVNTPDQALRLMMKMHQIKPPYLIILEDDPIPIQERMPGVHPKLAEIVDKSVRKDIQGRFQKAGEFRAALEKVVDLL